MLSLLSYCFVMHNKLIHVSIFKFALHQFVARISWNEIFGKVSTLPKLFANNLFVLVVDIVNGGGLDLGVFVAASSKHRILPQIEEIDDKVVEWALKIQLRLTYKWRLGDLCIDNEVIIDKSVFVQCPSLVFICKA